MPLVAIAAVIAALAFWHGATNSTLSKTALYLLPLFVVVGLAVRFFARAGSDRL
jgi:hypothetical protein